MTRTTWIVYRKELGEVLRDRYVLVSIMAVPLLFVVLFLVQGRLVQGRADSPVRVGLAGAAPHDFAGLLPASAVRISSVDDGSSAVRAGTVDLALDFMPADASGTSRAILYSDRNRGQAMRAELLVRDGIATYNRKQAQAALTARAIDSLPLEALRVNAVDLAPKPASGRTLIFFIPLLLMMASIVGGMGAAVNSTAGEKERHTLEALLLTPSTRGQVVTGKIMAVGTLALGTTMASVLVIVIALSFGSIRASNGDATVLSGPAVLVIAWLGLLLSLALAAAMVALGTLAKNFQQSSAYMMPLFLITMATTMVVAFAADWKPSLGYYAIPIFNAMLLMQDTLLRTPEIGALALTSGSLIALGILSWLAALQVFSRESQVTSGT